MQINKKEMIIISVTAWIIVTTGYVVNDIWENYKIKGIQAAYDSAFGQILNKAENTQCQPFVVYGNNGKQVELISTKCLNDQIENDSDGNVGVEGMIEEEMIEQ